VESSVVVRVAAGSEIENMPAYYRSRSIEEFSTRGKGTFQAILDFDEQKRSITADAYQRIL
jgi:hypothetical protein